jgi:DNA-binding IclR family transcriptional regulator
MDTFIGRRHQSLGEVADAVQLPKSTTHRLLMTLESRGYISSISGESGMYKIGLKGLWFTTARTRIHLQLEELRGLTGETVNLGAVTGMEIEYVDRVLSEHALRWGVDIGSRIPLHCSALGKCVLAYRTDLFPDVVDLPRRTAKTITDPVELKAHLEVIRHRGYAFEDEEFIEGVVCIAAPVRDDGGEVIGAVSVSGPCVRFTKEIAIGFAEQVMAIADSVSYSIGYNNQSMKEDA